MGSPVSPTGEIILEDTRVPKENILGKPGDGAKIVFGSLNQTRLSAAAGGVGLAQACLDSVTKYCNEREQFGKPIGQFQMNQDMVAQMVVEIEAARLMVYKAAWQKDQGNLGNNLEVAMAKYLAGEVVLQGLQVRHADPGGLRLFDRSTRWPGITGTPRPTPWSRARPTSASSSWPRISWGSGRQTGNAVHTGCCRQKPPAPNQSPIEEDKRCDRISRRWTIWASRSGRPR